MYIYNIYIYLPTCSIVVNIYADRYSQYIYIIICWVLQQFGYDALSITACHDSGNYAPNLLVAGYLMALWALYPPNSSHTLRATSYHDIGNQPQENNELGTKLVESPAGDRPIFHGATGCGQGGGLDTFDQSPDLSRCNHRTQQIFWPKKLAQLKIDPASSAINWLSEHPNRWSTQPLQVGLQVVTEAKKFLKPGGRSGGAAEQSGTPTGNRRRHFQLR